MSFMAQAGRIVLWPDAKVVTHLWLIYPTARVGDPLIEAVFELLREVWHVPLEAATR